MLWLNAPGAPSSAVPCWHRQTRHRCRRHVPGVVVREDVWDRRHMADTALLISMEPRIDLRKMIFLDQPGFSSLIIYFADAVQVLSERGQHP